VAKMKPARSPKWDISELISGTFTYGVLIVGAMLALFPLYWMVTSSIKTSADILRYPPNLVPLEMTYQHYQTVFEHVDFVRAFLNSVLVAVGRVTIVVVISAMTGYALSKLRFPGRGVLFVVILALSMIPGQLTIIPLFLLVAEYKLLNTFAALILPGAVNTFSIFLMRQAFLSVPDDYIDAALIDGASHFRIAFRIALPMVFPMVVTVVIVNTFWSWNDFLWPFLVTQSDQMRTLPLTLAKFSSTVMGVQRWGEIMSAATLTAAPMIAVFLVLQRRIVESLTMTGLK
jgi:multiple sugar transport system permease protein